MGITTIKSHGNQGSSGAVLALGQQVEVTGEHDGRPGTVTVGGIVRGFVERIDGRVSVTLSLPGGYSDTVAADSIWIHGDAEPAPAPRCCDTACRYFGQRHATPHEAPDAE
jgi:hypothetical protein